MAEVHQTPRRPMSENDPTIIYSESDAESSTASDSFALRSSIDMTSFHSTHDSNNLSPVLNNLPVSRPLSRSSMTSGLSVTATKDGVEGKRVKKKGIPGYSLNLINKMYANYANKGLGNGTNSKINDFNTHDLDSVSVENTDDRASVLSLSSMIPQYSNDDIQDVNDNVSEYTHRSHLGEVVDGPDNDIAFDAKSSGHDSFESSDYKTFLRRTTGPHE